MSHGLFFMPNKIIFSSKNEKSPGVGLSSWRCLGHGGLFFWGAVLFQDTAADDVQAGALPPANARLYGFAVMLDKAPLH